MSENGGASETKAVTTYAAAFKRLTRSLFRGGLTQYEFVDSLFTAMRKNFLSAWQEGRDKVGAGKMTDEDILRVQDIVAEQAQYAPGFAEFVRATAVRGGKFSDLLPRAEMWINKYGEVVAEAMVSAKGEQRFEWVYDPEKEHCEDCAALNGRVYAGKMWDKYGLRPLAYGLKCGPGRHCGCQLKPTRKPLTPGMPPVDLRGKSLSDLLGVQHDR